MARLRTLGVPDGWFPGPASAKAAGALGLLAGLAVPGLGVAAAIGLILYFVGAV
ncbi:DoxX family protein [Embleya scabrispora]|uniref:DoxX family protein n=1 Tax=Embleya scabrispora TaxID=159449 RepID=UPI0003777687|nr:DoxX family protein [Embleya scabrispora]